MRHIAALGWWATVVTAILVACSTTGNGSPDPGGAPGRPAAVASSTAGSAAGPARSSAPTSSSVNQQAVPVHIQLKFSDGSQFGVGIPVIAFFSRKITDAAALQSATTLRINGAPVTGGRWYFEASNADPGYPLEGDYRLQSYWPAHSSISVDMPVRGMSAGANLIYDDSLTSAFSVGASHIATVDNSTRKLTLLTDGTVEGVYPVSLGADDTPTARGVKVIMEKGKSICMHGPGYNDCGIKYTQRLTYGGEYLHSATWNTYRIIKGINSSNGCTNLLPTDAARLYSILEIGDVVTFPDANGLPMTMGAGYGDWNVPWSQWLTGGLISRI